MNDIVEQIQKQTTKELGEGVMIDASVILDNKKQVVPISPSIDVGLGGGVPEGSWVNFSGAPKVGKTVTSLKLAANAQKMGKFVYYYNIEGRIKDRDITGVYNLKPDMIKVIGSVKGKILTAEEYLDHAYTTITTHPECIIIIDSTSALCSSKEYSDNITGQTRSLGPKMLGSFCRKACNVVPVQNTIVILIQHVIANTSGYGSPYMEDGGNKIQFQSDVKMRCTSAQKWIQKEKQIGQVINWVVHWSGLGAPGAKVQSYLRYGYGIDEVTEVLHLGADLGIITKGGAWYTYNDHKFQGEEKFVDFLRENPEIVDEIYTTIKGML